MQTVEPLFGITKRVFSWIQASMRRLESARGEQLLPTMARNISRLHVPRAV